MKPELYIETKNELECCISGFLMWNVARETYTLKLGMLPIWRWHRIHHNLEEWKRK